MKTSENINIVRQEFHIRLQHILRLIRSCNREEQLENMNNYYKQLSKILRHIVNKYDPVNEGYKYLCDISWNYNRDVEQLWKHFDEQFSKVYLETQRKLTTSTTL